MSGVPPIDEPRDAELTAAEYVLGVLDAPERTAAQARLAEPGFEREVAAWEARLAPIADAIAPVTPPPTVWPAVVRVIASEAQARSHASATSSAASNVVELRLRRTVSLWRGVSAAAAALAAALALAVVWPRSAPPPPVAPVLAPVMTASLAAKPGERPAFVATMDPVRRELTVMPAAVTLVSGRTPELWLLPQGETPVALGLVDFGRPIRMAMSHAVGLVGRTTLAISVEPPGGSPTGQPTGPVIASGALRAL